MIRQRQAILNRLHLALDMGLTAVAFVLAYFVKRNLLPEPFRGLITEPNYYIVLLMILIVWYLAFNAFELYRSFRRQGLQDIILGTLKALGTGMLIVFLLIYVLKLEGISRILMGLFFLLNLSLLIASKTIIYNTLSHYRKNGYNFRNVLVVGCRERAREAIRAVELRKEAGFRVLGCVDPDETMVGAIVKPGVTVLDSTRNLERMLRHHVVDELVFAMPLKKIQHADKILALAENMGISTRIIPDWQLHYLAYTPRVARIFVEDFLGIPTMALKTTPRNYAGLIVKTGFDYLFSGLALLILSPAFLVISAAIKLSSPGPVFFKQERCGLNGRHFMAYKFRTMVADAEARRRELEELNEADGPVFKLRRDPRVIPVVGTLLRKTGLDELPQLINVLKGEMSLIGPRPPIPSEVDVYDIWHRRRLSMRPGLTCIWQCSPNRNDVSFDQWMKMDLQYIDNWNLWLDLKIFFGTIKTMLLASGR